DTLSITPAPAAPSPSFTKVSGNAVLIVKDLSLGATLTVTGSLPLVVIATGDVSILAPVNADATDLRPGPGGGWQKGAFPAVGIDGGGVLDGRGQNGG